MTMFGGKAPVIYLIFNGPPGCGKDTAVKHLYSSRERITSLNHCNWYIDRFSMPLKTAICGWVGMEINQYGYSKLEDNKDRPSHLFKGSTYRREQISLSEDHIKKRFGATIFGEWLQHRAERHQVEDVYFDHMTGNNVVKPLIVLVPDGGFVDEADAILDDDNKLITHVHRDGCSFDIDSRSFTHSARGHHVDIVNSKIADYWVAVTLATKDFLKSRGIQVK